jgi:hypothetical protein
MSPKIIIRFAIVNEQTDGPIKRIIGFVPARHLLTLFDNLDLDANPRSAKVGSVTADILDTLTETPRLFHFKSKGVLLGTSDYVSLERNRYELNFGDPSAEGILDGGHNMLAIGIHIMKLVAPEAETNKIRLWEDLRAAWDKHRPSIEDLKEELSFLVPVELLVPTDPGDDESLETFEASLLEICAARNNNAQLTQETKSNQKGFFLEIKSRLPEKVASRVEWKTNEWESDDIRPIKARDVIALAWIPLNRLSEAGFLPGKLAVTPQNIYRNKGECSKQFERLMERDDVTNPTDGARRELHNESIMSAFDVLADLPTLYDKIYAEFPAAYNAGGGRFGGNNIVKMYDPVKRKTANNKNDYVATQPYTHFTDIPVKHRYPDGLIMPLVYGLKGIMKIVDGRVVWADDPTEFLDRNLKDIASAYRLVLDMARFDPQKLAKNQASHEFAVGEFEKALFKEQARELIH